MRHPFGPLLTGEGLCNVEFQRALEDAQNWFVCSADIKNAFHQMRIPIWLQAFLCTARFSRMRSWLHRKNDRPKTSCSRFFDISCSYNTSDGFFMGDVFLSRCHGSHARSREVLILLFSFVVTTSTPPLLGSKLGLGSAGFRWSYADNFGVLARGANCTNVHLARFIAGVQKVGFEVHDRSLASGSADNLGYEASLANASCSGTGKRISRIRSVARTVSSRRRTSGRETELVSGHESFWRSAIVELSRILTQVSSSRGRRIWFPESRGQLCVWRKEHLVEILCLLRSDWSLRWLDVCICTDASEKSFAFAVREGYRELASEVGRVDKFKRCSRSIVPGCASPSRRRSVCSVQVRTRMMSLARVRPGRESLQLLALSEWRLAAYGGFFS